MNTLPLERIHQRLDALRHALAAAMQAGEWQEAAGIERERAQLIHELFERDHGLAPSELRVIAETLLLEQREFERELAGKRRALMAASASSRRGIDASNTYLRHASLEDTA